VQVVYALDPLDEYVFQNTPEFEGKRFVNVGKQGVNVGDEKRYASLRSAPVIVFYGFAANTPIQRRIFYCLQCTVELMSIYL
jgi:hypothetical protein